jgi:superoxide dismutase
MELHHDKHHATYVNSYNDAVEKLADAQAKGDIQSQVALQTLTNFHGGGHINHTLFWENLAPRSAGGGEPPSGPLGKAIDEAYGSLKDFKATFNTALAGIQGSGWAWLVKDKQTDKIGIKTYAVSIISVYPISFNVLKYQQLLIYESLPSESRPCRRPICSTPWHRCLGARILVSVPNSSSSSCELEGRTSPELKEHS